MHANTGIIKVGYTDPLMIRERRESRFLKLKIFTD